MSYVLTLRLDPTSQEFFERLRRLYFPPERNQIPAHLTMFHTLPERGDVADTLRAEAGAQAMFGVAVTGVRSLGKGVAYRLTSGVLAGLHGRLSERFTAELSAQDRQRFQAHIVVQNKVTPAAARELLASLEGSFAPMEVQAEGMDLWRYMGGPWELAETFLFPRDGI